MSDYTGCSYVAFIDVEPSDGAKCSDCGWEGRAGALQEVEDCSLTPGDPSPAGRCPKCGCIAYLKEPA